MVINAPSKCTHLDIWWPRYSSKYDYQYGEKVALLHKDKTDHATPLIIIEFTKARDLLGQRFAIKKTEAQKHKVGTNGSADMYEVPLSHLDSWESVKEILDVIKSFGW